MQERKTCPLCGEQSAQGLVEHFLRRCAEMRDVSAKLPVAICRKIPREWAVRPILGPHEATWPELEQILEWLTHLDTKLAQKKEKARVTVTK